MFAMEILHFIQLNLLNNMSTVVMVYYQLPLYVHVNQKSDDDDES